jgi:hypothetical protein
MKTLFLATVMLAIAGAGTLQAADIFACSGLGYAAHNGRVELDCTAPVTTHWTKLGGHSSALVSYIDEPDGLHVAVTTTQLGMKERAPVERFETALAPGQSVAVSIPFATGKAPARIVLSNAGGHLHIAEPAALGAAQ